MCSVASPPRISFSDDVGQDGGDQELEIEPEEPSRRDMSLLDSSSEFEFSICRSCLEQEPSLADELFADGMILPAVRIQDTLKGSAPAITPPATTPSPSLIRGNGYNLYKARPGSCSPLPPLPTSEKNTTRDQRVVAVNCDQVEEKQPAQASKSFWRFKRSNSLNCDVRKSLIWSLPLLSRSNSTGSVPSPKASTTTNKDNHKRGSNRQQPIPTGKPSSNSSYVYSLPQQKPPLKKNYSGTHGNGVWISPVLNVPPPPYITKGTGSLLGFGSFLRSSAKEKKSRK